MINILHDWQDLAAGILAFFAGILGFSAAIYAVSATLRGERRRDERELLAIQQALTAEIFQFATLALEAHKEVKRLATTRPNAGVTIHDLEEATRFPDPVIYPNTANRLGLLGDHANDVVKAHPVVPGWSICSIRVPGAGDLRRARGGTGWRGRDR